MGRNEFAIGGCGEEEEEDGLECGEEEEDEGEMLDIDSLTLADVLKGKRTNLKKAFERFLEDHFCSEDYLFLLAIERYSAVDDGQGKGDKEVFMSILNEFLHPDSLHESAVSGPTVDRLWILAEKDVAPPINAFEDAQIEVWITLQTDTFLKFKKSDALREFVENESFGNEAYAKRKKLEDFFGCPIRGSLKRCELVDMVLTAPISSTSSKVRLRNQGLTKFAFWRSRSRSHTIPSNGLEEAGQRNHVTQSFSYPPTASPAPRLPSVSFPEVRHDGDDKKDPPSFIPLTKTPSVFE